MTDVLKREVALTMRCLVLCLVPFFAGAQSTSWEQDYRSGVAARAQGKFTEAKDLLERALGESDLTVHDIRRASMESMLAAVCQVLGKTEEAERVLHEAETILEGPRDPNPVVEFLVLDDVGSYRATQGRLKEAEAFLKQSLEIGISGLGENHANIASVKSNLGQVYMLEGRLADAQPLMEQAVEVHRATLPPTNLDRLSSASALGTLYSLQGRYALAEPLLQKINEDAAQLGELHPYLAESLVMLADLHRLEGNRSRGEPLLRKALFIYEKSFGSDSPRVATTLLDMSLDTLAEGKPALAEAEIGRALTILRRTNGPDHITVALGEYRLALAYIRLKKYSEAKLLLDHALPIQEATYPAGHAVTADCLYALAQLAVLQHQSGDADQYYQGAISMYEKSGAITCPAMREALREYAKLVRTNHPVDAKVFLARAKQLDQVAKSLK